RYLFHRAPERRLLGLAGGPVDVPADDRRLALGVLGHRWRHLLRGERGEGQEQKPEQLRCRARAHGTIPTRPSASTAGGSSASCRASAGPSTRSDPFALLAFSSSGLVPIGAALVASSRVLKERAGADSLRVDSVRLSAHS